MSLRTALSDYGQQLSAEREALVARLCTALTGAQADEPQHAEAVQACLAALQHHRFADPNPREVDDAYDRLGARLNEHAQFGKQRALRLLCDRLRSLPLQSTQVEFQHRLLAFLSAASRAPLSTQYSGSGLVEALEAQARTALVGPPTYLSDASSEGWEEEAGAFSPGSQLSDWSHLSAATEEDGEQGDAEGRSAVAAPQMPSVTAASGDEQAAQQQATERGPAATLSVLLEQQQAAAAAATAALAAALGRPLPAGLAAPQAARRETPYTRSSLSVWLASKASGGQPARLLEPRLCFHERELVQQVIHMLKGVAHPGPAFQLDAVRDAYAPRPGVHLHSSSHGSARSLLARFAQAATAIRRVQAFCATAVRCSGSVGAEAAAGGGSQEQQEERRLYSLPTVSAFAAAVAEQQQVLQQQVLVLEAAFSSGALTSLLQLAQRTTGLAQQAALLAALARRCCAWRGSAAETSAGLLSGLYDALQLQLLQARSQGGVAAAMLLRIFTATCRPQLAVLHGWLYRGQLDDPAGEFFLQASGASIPTDSPRFWSDAYTLRRTAATAAPAVPCFLLPLADSILSAGKAALLLNAYSSWRLAAAAARGSAAAPAGGSAAPEVFASPSKRRLSEYGALGFAIAAGQGPGQHSRPPHPYGVPPPAAAALADSLVAAGSDGDAPGPEPLLLHQQLLQNLEAQLQEQLAFGGSLSSPVKGSAQLLTVAGATGATAAGASPAGSRSSDASSSGTSGGSHTCHEEWQQACAACEDHTLLLPPEDALPQLPAVPASADRLPAAPLATIAQPPLGLDGQPPAEPPVQQTAAGVAASSGVAQSSNGQPTIGDRMRAAAAARTAQACCTAAAQLSLLIIPPAPLEAMALAAGSRAQANGTAAACEAQQAQQAQQFDGAVWQEWYRRVASSLSQQLQVLDSISAVGSSSSSAATSSRRLAGGYRVPLGLPRYTNASPSEQLWGRSGSPAASSASLLGVPGAQPLQPQLAAAAPPLDVVLQHSLLRPVRTQVDAASGALCTALLRHGLLRQLAALRDTYLLGSPLLEPFVSVLLRSISTSGGMDRLSEFEANSALQDALTAGGRAPVLRMTAHIAKAAVGTPGAAGATPTPPSAAGVQQRVQALSRLRLRCEPGWPLGLVVGEEMLAQYNSVFVLLLQLLWVKQSLKSVRYHGWKAGRQAAAGGTARDALQHQMVHLVDSVLQYINDRVLAAGAWLEQAMEECTSLDEMHRCRAKYLRAVTRYCLLSSEGVARLVHEGLLHLLNACLQYCALHKQVTTVAAALRAGSSGSEGAGGSDGQEDEQADGGAAGGAWAHLTAARRAELPRRGGEATRQLAALRKEFGNRQRLLLRVLSTKAAEAGSHADELRQLLGALDFSRWFERSMA
ncbi:gamma-tubulin complex component 5-like [Chlorella sorokiniana]|uniref:Gamma-tubulin complex component 5-like n=1 Tax=Chlorella sorokiniana TaxID=3076 RepID=A0A2P6TNY1_CHLSO|nr:gamma-tubulin complex component 5-like [Chlorella sorokiniana]|eukprot:PRW51046.1 gamma-tubulin complex component 5-like [Chlorella sorokiniana]